MDRGHGDFRKVSDKDYYPIDIWVNSQLGNGQYF